MDTPRAATLRIETIDYGLGDGPQKSYTARITSPYSGDRQVRIEIRSANPGESEDEDGGTQADRSPTGLWSEMSAPIDRRIRGTSFRAIFSAFNDKGDLVWKTQRTLHVP